MKHHLEQLNSSNKKSLMLISPVKRLIMVMSFVLVTLAKLRARVVSGQMESDWEKVFPFMCTELVTC